MVLQPSKLTLYSRHLSQPSTAIRIAASLKNIPLIVHDVATTPPQKQHEVLKSDIRDSAPIVLAEYDNGESLVLTQSLNIMDFLEESYPSRCPLLPPVTDMAARSTVKDLAALIACDTEPFSHMKSLLKYKHNEGDPKKQIRKILSGGIQAFEHRVQSTAGVYSVGDELSIADIYVTTVVEANRKFGWILDEAKGCTLGARPYPVVERIVKACRCLPDFMEAKQGVAKVRRAFHRREKMEDSETEK